MDLNELNSIRDNFKDGWNGEGSKSLDPQVHENIVNIINDPFLSPRFENWDIVLRTNGSVTLMSEDKIASIDIARSHLSFSVETNGDNLVFQRHLEFDPDILAKILDLYESIKVLNGRASKLLANQLGNIDEYNEYLKNN